MSLPPEILKKVKLLEISTRRIVNNLFAGEYHSAFKGQGMTFSDFREYVPGDEVRAISWAVTARTGKPFIKKFDEERERTLILAVDISGSANFGTQKYFKGEIITHLAALLSFSAQKNKDAVGLLLFSDQVEHFVPPKKTPGHIHRILRDLFYFEPKSKKTSIRTAAEHLSGILKKKANIFVFSDFMDQGFDKSLRMLGSKHETVAVIVRDPAELDLPAVGLVEVEDAETGEIVTVDTSSTVFRRDYLRLKQKQDELRRQELKRAQVDCIEILSDRDYVAPLISYFKRKNHR